MAKSNCPSLDTNVLLRLVLDDVPEQSKIIKALLNAKTKYQVADPALIEMVFVLEKVYQLERPYIVDNIMFIVRHPQFICNRTLFETIVPVYLFEPALSITDCALLGYARLNNATPLYTFDKKLVAKSEGDAKHPS